MIVNLCRLELAAAAKHYRITDTSRKELRLAPCPQLGDLELQ